MPISGKLANLQLNRAPARFVKEYVIEKKKLFKIIDLRKL